MMRRRYILAVGLTVAATVASLLLAPHWAPIHLLLPFYPAVMLSAWFGGLGPGLCTTVASALVINYYWLPPIDSLGISETGDWIGFFLFLGVGLPTLPTRRRPICRRWSTSGSRPSRRFPESNGTIVDGTARAY